MSAECLETLRNETALDDAPGILRFATAGSVDDGKSSLIGRLLYDSKSILEDQLLSIESASRRRGSDHVELALLTDGLRAEREQNITIDVAYRYFSTPRRKFIVADTPGHLQYTRNMVTGTSTADLSVILIDARNGVVSQSKRHAAISALLGVPQLVIAVNKMDLVDFDKRVFEGIESEFRSFAERLDVDKLTFIPISALHGDNVVERSSQTPWYGGPSLLEFLEGASSRPRHAIGFRLPVQFVVRWEDAEGPSRGLAGRVESGCVAVGESVRIASSGIEARVESIHAAGREVECAGAGSPVLLTLSLEVDVSRGDLLTSPNEPTAQSDRFEAVLSWLHDSPLEIGKRYLLAHGANRALAVVESVLERIDVDTLLPYPAKELRANDLGRVVVRAARPLHFDPYNENRATGSFVLIDQGTNATAAAGMIHLTAPKPTVIPTERSERRDLAPLTEPVSAIVDAYSAPDLLRWADREFGDQISLACSFGAEDVVLLDILHKVGAKARVFVLDTGRLHQETYDVMQRCREKYGVEFDVFSPDTSRLQQLIRLKGPNSFYDSIENRKECCGIRKVEPLRRALADRRAWITGLRREQAVTRQTLPKIEQDETHGGIYKLNPLAEWTEEQVWEYIRANDVPYNALHDRGFRSIGCDPCTRAVAPGEDVRAGRWWWESPEHKECGLHVRN